MTLHRELTEQQRVILADDIPDVDVWWANLCRKWPDPIEAEAIFARKLADLAPGWRTRTDAGNYKNRAERDAIAENLIRDHQTQAEARRAEHKARIDEELRQTIRQEVAAILAERGL